MIQYRLYFLDERGHIARRLDFECAGDEEAAAWALEKSDGRAMELWRGAARIKRFERRD